MNDTIKHDGEKSEATAQAEKITELLKDEQYVYQGKVYSHRALYKTSSLKTVIFIVYAVVMLVGVLGVVWWTYLKPIGIGAEIRLPSFLLGESEPAPTVRVRPPVEKTAPAADSLAATSTVEAIESENATSTQNTQNTQDASTTKSVIPGTATSTTAATSSPI